jgi:hypothetical protein
VRLTLENWNCWELVPGVWFTTVGRDLGFDARELGPTSAAQNPASRGSEVCGCNPEYNVRIGELKE